MSMGAMSEHKHRTSTSMTYRKATLRHYRADVLVEFLLLVLINGQQRQCGCKRIRRSFVPLCHRSVLRETRARNLPAMRNMNILPRISC